MILRLLGRRGSARSLHEAVFFAMGCWGWLNPWTVRWSVTYGFKKRLFSKNPGGVGWGFSNYIIYILWNIFRTKTPLEVVLDIIFSWVIRSYDSTRWFQHLSSRRTHGPGGFNWTQQDNGICLGSGNIWAFMKYNLSQLFVCHQLRWFLPDENLLFWFALPRVFLYFFPSAPCYFCVLRA